ncbi:MAG: hypothetical protein GAK33_05829 [Burkholderia lata]|uniref:Purine nucleoside phosphorylase n=1 Tax=Burkholderia lata (strain ATCC 17760 / DSM 23089 / LMG 22485 / NCIMB 9086 / R18194 / 383) TaxID=482957 RepID=A0A833PM86_BURL3|nr:DUF4148 domain-containing protein [Burkholderia lata]KAF1033988.1 MAG: hypothetical protein GAK33_05829 [Burkholderia lata]
MKSLLSPAVAALILSIPGFAFAQQADHQLTRAEVKAEMAKLVAAGYSPAMDHNQYPTAILAAEKRVRENAVAQAGPNTAPAAETTGFGSEGQATSGSGHTLMVNGRDAVYRGH